MYKEKSAHFVYSFLLLFGLFSPTSINEVIQNQFYIFSSLIFLVVFIGFVPKKMSSTSVLCFLAVNISLLIFTITSPFTELTLGIFPNFFILSLLFFCDLKTVTVSRGIRSFFLLASAVLIIFGLGVILQIKTITDFILSFYSSSYETLLSRMIAVLKPVGTFATHSVSALFMFLFFFLNIYAYQKNKKPIYILFSVLFLIMLFFIRSNTSIFYLGIAFFLFFYLFRQGKKSIILFSILATVVIYFLMSNYSLLNDTIDNYDFSTIFDSNANGLNGRYAKGSILKPTIDYILNNPFSPIGLSYSPNLYYTDSGFILYLLRGSIILMVAIYIGVFKLLYDNILNKKLALFVFFIIFIFEIGYPILINFRMLFFLPFLVILLNHLDNYLYVKS